MAMLTQISMRCVKINFRNFRSVHSRNQSGSADSGNEFCSKQNNNASIRTDFCNRNPRNLEQMTIASKPEGYHLDRFNVHFWHKLLVTATSSKVSAEVVHNNGSVVVSASSSEFGIRKLLYRPTDVSAFQTIGKVIARRCLESGINTVYCEQDADEGTKLGVLMKEAKKGGLLLEEAESYKKPFPHTRGVPTKPWEIIN